MKTYNVKLVSQTNAVILVFFLLIVIMSSIHFFAPDGVQNMALSLLLLAVTFAIAYFLWQWFVTARTQWTINEDGVSMIWIKQFAFTKDYDFSLKWNEIESLKKGADRNYHHLKIKVVTGITIDFYHDYLTRSDQFQEFMKDFNAKLKEKKLQSPSAAHAG